MSDAEVYELYEGELVSGRYGDFIPLAHFEQACRLASEFFHKTPGCRYWQFYAWSDSHSPISAYGLRALCCPHGEDLEVSTVA